MTREQDNLQLELLADIRFYMRELVLGLTPPGPAVAVQLYEEVNRRKVKVGNKMEIIKPNAKKKLSVAFTDAAGRAALVDGVPSWVISDESHATLTPAADGMSCEVAFNGNGIGKGTIQVKADSDMTAEGVEELIGTYEYELVSGKAVFAKITAEDIAEEAPVQA